MEVNDVNIHQNVYDNDFPHILQRKIVRRDVEMPDKKVFQFDILSQGNPSVVVFTFDTERKTTTLLKEYQPGPNQLLYGTVAGMYECGNGKHATALQCAQYELEEEARLRSERWIPLLNDEHTSIPFDKYSDNRFYLFLALDCKSVENPRERDEGEFIDVEHGVSKERLLDIINHGQMNVASSFCILLGMQKLSEMGYW